MQTSGSRRSVEVPPARLLGNGNYTVLITGAATGRSTCSGYALTPWEGDRVQDADGFVLYVRDVQDGSFLALGARSTSCEMEPYVWDWNPGRFQVRTRLGVLGITLDVAVLPDSDCEIRRLTIENRCDDRRTIDVTSFVPVALDRPAAFRAHPAFSKLFVQTEVIRDVNTLLARRRPRANEERHPWLAHTLVDDAEAQWETDRARFLGRGNTSANPLAMRSHESLSGTVGNVLDPCLSLRRVLQIGPRGSVCVSFILACAPDRESLLHQLADLRGPDAAERSISKAAVRETELLRALGITLEEARRHQTRLCGAIHGDPRVRKAQGQPARADLEVAALGGPGHALLHADLPGGGDLVPEYLRGLRYWLQLGSDIGLTISGCDREIPPEKGLVTIMAGGGDVSRLRALEASALLVAPGAELDAASRDTADPAWTTPQRVPVPARVPEADRASHQPTAGVDLVHWNGVGGFTKDGREYVQRLVPNGAGGLGLPPQPWIHVLANEEFGCLLSETGAGYTWAQNSREHRLTPWRNDPLTDPHVEALFVRDEETGEFWSPLPGPARAIGRFEVRYGFGYAVTRHAHDDMDEETTVFVPPKDPVKVTRLRVVNRGSRDRRISVSSYQQLCLGTDLSAAGRAIITERDETTGSLFARSRSSSEFARGVAFSALHHDGATPEFTCDRLSYLGPAGSLSAPLAIRAGRALDGATGSDLDPCFAQRIRLTVKAGSTVEVIALLGEADGHEAARSLSARYSDGAEVARALDATRGSWHDLVSRLQVDTPSSTLDTMANGWLTYQVLACRMWGRSAFYQSGGAYGFRDQLQDAAALMFLRPDVTRSQILLHAAHQFVEGDALHWWHPPASKGIRTRFTDDLLWLPYLTASYVRATGDHGVLREKARFLAAPVLEPGEDERYLAPEDARVDADLYEHCCRAIDRSLVLGEHGLPLFGTGDWNDGMNRVGRLGKGESVWMGFFLHAVLREFLPIVHDRGDSARAARYGEFQGRLMTALNGPGWDGGWYRRAWYDDGTPLGSEHSDECKIDALVQAWSVLSGAAPEERAAVAMDAVERHLVSEDAGIIRLLTPAFENTPHDPGYIKGYVPGVRENGGQYTHAAMWVVRAAALLGRRNRAAALLDMLNPITHSDTPERVARYQVEPYVVAADVYGEPPHVGRGGWTWYTGSAGWMYRVAIESILGFEVLEGRWIRIQPCVPDAWDGYRIRYRVPGSDTTYEITVENPDRAAASVVEAALDGVPVPIAAGAAIIPLTRDSSTHRVTIRLGAERQPQ